MPVRDAVRGACELLGLDPLHIANEGQFLAVVAAGARPTRRWTRSDAAPGGAAGRRSSARSARSPPGAVLVTTRYGGSRVVDMLVGDPLPQDLLRWRVPPCSRHAIVATSDRGAAPRRQESRLRRAFFAREALRLAEACREMSERFLRGGRLLAFGRGPYATDAQHVSVEFVHPVIVGKRALPALDLSPAVRPWLDALCRPEDMVMGFGPPEGDAEVAAALGRGRARGA